MIKIKNRVNISLLKNYLKKNKITKNNFSKQCNISPITLNKILAEKQVYNISSLYKITKVMNIKFYELFK